MTFFLLFLSATFSAVANVLLRVAGQIAESQVPMLAIRLDPRLIQFGALGAYGLGFGVYALALRKVPVAVGYPLMVGICVLELLLVAQVFGEGLTWRLAAGSVLMMIAIVLFSGA